MPHPPFRVKRVWSENKRSISCFFYVSVCWSTCTADVGCVLWLILRPRYITKHTNSWYIATRLHWSCDLWSWSCEREIRLEIVCHTTRSCELRGLNYMYRYLHDVFCTTASCGWYGWNLRTWGAFATLLTKTCSPNFALSIWSMSLLPSSLTVWLRRNRYSRWR